ncbi:ABC transporter ATP-binding protein [Bacillus sp. FJAT-45037]|uniref:ABC transporter ATP-binding protein n=1 Tax=Bacillus sp. FJAT-45037 TaxID=2011007 RepID=UPI000C236940|nr:ABC transporter ATP-binding protein [Bacillus sp. FJAT-45037]
MRIKSVSKLIKQKSVLENIDFTIERGKITGIIGRNGAGKTTLLKLMVGILKPDQGDVLVNQASIYAHPEVKQHVVFVPDSPEALKTYSIKEICQLYKDIFPNFDEDLFYELLDRFTLPNKGKVGSFSKGMKALFALVLAFSTKAQYILLDEPTDGLDVIAKKRILQFIVEAVADYQVGVVISSHRLDELEYLADSIIMLENGGLSKTYSIDSIKESYLKVQAVFPAGLPESVKEFSHVLEHTGKVFILIIENSKEEGLMQLKQANPLFMEELPMTLEDLFVAKLGGDQFVG